MNGTTANPFSQDTHEHPLSEEYQPKEYLCHACHTLGYGTSKRCSICEFDLHDYCATCPAKIHSPKLHPGHSMQLGFERVGTPGAASPGFMRVCDVCGDEVDGLYYRCAGCDLDVHPLCLQLPLQVRLEARHPDHDLIFGHHQGGTSTCNFCGKQCKYWWYRCVKNSCTAAKVDIHPECLVKHGIRSLRPRPTQETSPQQQPQHHDGYPTAGPLPSAPPLSSGDNPYNGYQDFQRIHLLNQQYYYSASHHQQQHYAYQHYDPRLQRLHSYPSAYVTHHVPPPHQIQHSHSSHFYYPHPPQTPNMLMQNGAYGYSPAANAFGHPYSSYEASPNISPAQDGGDDNPNGKKRQRIYALVGNLLFSAVTLGIFGVPSFFG